MSIQKYLFFIFILFLSINSFTIDNCSICLEEIRSEKEVLPCGHIFCTECISKWFREKLFIQLDCPICRQKTTPLDLRYNTSLKIDSVTRLRVKEISDKLDLLELQNEAFFQFHSLIKRLVKKDILKTTDPYEKYKQQKIYLRQSIIKDNIIKEIFFYDDKKQKVSDNNYLESKILFANHSIKLLEKKRQQSKQDLQELKEHFKNSFLIEGEVNYLFSKLDSSLESISKIKDFFDKDLPKIAKTIIEIQINQKTFFNDHNSCPIQ